MKDSTSPSKPNAPKSEVDRPFKKMTPPQKAVFLVKLVVCIITGGFVFPNVM